MFAAVCAPGCPRGRGAMRCQQTTMQRFTIINLFLEISTFGNIWDWKDVWMIEDHYSHYPPLAQTRRCHLSWQQHAFWLFEDAYAVHNFLYHAVYLGILGCQQTFLLSAIPCHQPCLRGGPGLPLRSPAVVFGSHGLLPEKATSGMLSR